MIKEKYLGAYMKTAKVFAELSTARRKQVGAVVVKDDRIISIGYNGMPSGWDNNCEDEISYPDAHGVTLKTKPEVLHAEMNCLMKIAQSNESSRDATMFTTTAPCFECAKAIFQSGIEHVVYEDDYRSEDGIYFLQKSGVKVTRFAK